MNHLSKITKADYTVVLLAPFIATFITVYFHVSFLLGTVLYFIIPAVYLNIRKTELVRKLLMVSLTLSIPFTIIIDYFAIRDGSWWDATIFPFRILNGIPIEDFLWFFAWFYYILVFYEYFIDRPRRGKDAPLNQKYKKMLVGWYGALVVFFVLYIFLGKSLYIPYFYLTFMVVLGVIPLSLMLIKHSNLVHKYAFLLPISSYFSLCMRLGA